MRKLCLASLVLLLVAITANAQVLQQASITLSNEQIKALATTPIEIVSAPGAGKMIYPSAAVAYLHWNANYSNIASAAALNVSHDNGVNLLTALFEASGSSSVSNLLNDDEDYLAIFTQKSEIANGQNVGFYLHPAGIVNKNLTVGLYNAGAGNLTGGHPSNTLKITVYFVVFEVN